MAKKRQRKGPRTARARSNFPPRLRIPKGAEIRDVNPAAIPEPYHVRDEERSYRNLEDKK